MKQLEKFLFKPLLLSVSDTEKKLIIIHSVETSNLEFLDEKRTKI